MSYKWPKPTYIALPAAGIPPLAHQMLEHWAEHQDWWHSVPFGWITGAILVFWFGVLFQDLLNENSAIRHDVREWRKVFSVLNISAAHLNDPERIDIVCLMKFRKRFDGLLTVRVVVPLAGRDSDIKLIHKERIDIADGEEKRLRLGSISITKPGDAFARHSLWGEKLGVQDVNGHPIYAVRNIIEISVGPQTFRVYAHVLDATRKEQSHVYLLKENELPDFHN